MHLHSTYLPSSLSLSVSPIDRPNRLTRTSASAPPVARTPQGCTSALNTGSFLPASPPCHVICGVVIFIVLVVGVGKKAGLRPSDFCTLGGGGRERLPSISLLFWGHS